MKLNRLSKLFSLGMLLMAFAISAFAQKNFNNSNVEYTFRLPNDTWKMTVEPSEYSPNVEFVYNFKKDGHFEIRKIKTEPNTLFGEVIGEEEQKLQFKPGYVAGKEENFQGAFSGRVFNYEYVRSGRKMSGRFYYLKANSTTLYVIRFTGLKNKLRSVRNETDAIARSFKLKTKK